MKSKSIFSEVLLIGLLVAPFLGLLAIWPQLPQRLVSHYDWQGRPNDSLPKETLTLLLGGLTVFLYVLMRYLPQIDPKQQAQNANFQRLRVVMAFFWSGLLFWMGYAALHETEGSTLLNPVLGLVSLLLAGMGNYLGSIKPNYWVGIRTPWTLENPLVWRRTHQFAGRLWFFGGLLCGGIVLLVPTVYKTGVFISIVLVLVLVPVFYSYALFRQTKNTQLN